MILVKQGEYPASEKHVLHHIGYHWSQLNLTSIVYSDWPMMEASKLRWVFSIFLEVLCLCYGMKANKDVWNFFKNKSQVNEFETIMYQYIQIIGPLARS